ncbi:MAG: TAXI family TRAP transporter solute-binding subunit [Firmicutes bacterium]|nr:TAXI family TRAP transporter solute-binding subunit [Bacillota bacterium]MDD4335943.1 TAXI family TRAP transporter solute-binding subunit [Bacillota bacterium]MDD4792207.1 TAXI family TRAP transporter solute-binding subunit [Bacillota bacterium]
MRKSLLLIVVVMFLTVSIGASSATNLVLATGGTAGTYYPLGGAIASIANKLAPKLRITAQATSASSENMQLIGKRQADLALVQNDIADYAYKGIETFAGKSIKNFGAIASLYPELVHFVVKADGPIKSWADVKGKRISVGARNSGTEANARQILEAYGLTYADVDEQFLSFADSAEQFKAGRIDGFFATSGVPNAGIADVAAKHKIRILTMDSNTMQKLTSKYQFFVSTTIPANSYANQTAPATTPAVMAILIAGNHVSESDVYEITKSLFENDGQLAKAHAKGSLVRLRTAMNGLSTPLHPGAAKYYKEKGLIK